MAKKLIFFFRINENSESGNIALSPGNNYFTYKHFINREKF